MNNAQIMGRLTKEPELKYSQNGKAYCRFTLAVDDGIDQTGGRKAIFLDCNANDKQAENLCKFQGKGSLVVVTGKISVNDWEKTDGTKVRQYQIQAYQIHYTGKAEKREQPSLGSPVYGYPNINISDGDLPF